MGKIGILVNNAGGYRLFTNDLTRSLTVLDITQEEWRRVMESNLTTTFMTCRAVLPRMMERRCGVIVNPASKNVARRGRAGQDAKSGKFAYYVCQSLIKLGSGACDTPRLNARRFEELVVEKIRSNILTEGNITSLVKVVGLT